MIKFLKQTVEHCGNIVVSLTYTEYFHGNNKETA
jgi:hypothetical protein